MQVHRTSYLWLLLLGCVALTTLTAVAQSDEYPLIIRILQIQQENERRVDLQFYVIGPGGTSPGTLSTSNVWGEVGQIRLNADDVRRVTDVDLLPSTTILLVDVSSTMSQSALRSQLPGLVEGLRLLPRSQIVIIPFSDRIEPGFGADLDRGTIIPAQAGNLDAAQAFITGNDEVPGLRIRTDMAPNSNIVIDVINAAVQLVPDDDPHRTYSIIIVTDTTDTAFELQENLSNIRETMRERRIAYFAIPVPDVLNKTMPDTPIHTYFATYGGYVYPATEEMTTSAVNTQLADQIGNVLSILQVQYHATLLLNPLRGQGLVSGPQLLTINVNAGNASGQADTLIDYLEMEYEIAFVGLPDDGLLTGEVTLQLDTSALPPGGNYRYTFLTYFGAEVQSVLCTEELAPRCVVNTTVQVPPGSYSLEAVVQEDGEILARVRVPINVYRENVSATLPASPLSGRVILNINTLPFPEVNLAQLFLTANGEDYGLVAETNIVDDDTRLVWDAQATLFDSGAFTSDEEVTVTLCLDLRTLGATEALIVRRTWSDLTAVSLPEFSLNVTGLPDLQPGQNLLPITGEVSITASVSPAPPPDQGYALQLLIANLSTEEPLVYTHPVGGSTTQQVYHWDTSEVPPGRYTLRVALVQDNEVRLLEDYDVNVYRTGVLVETTTPFSGVPTVTVVTRGYAADSVRLYARTDQAGEYEMVAESALGTGETLLSWNVQEALFSDPEALDIQVVGLRVELYNIAGGYLVALWEADVTARRLLTYTLALEGLPEPATPGQPVAVQSPVTLTGRVDPPLPTGAGYTLALVMDDVILAADSADTISYTWDPTTVPAGLHVLGVLVRQDGNLIEHMIPAVRPVHVYRTLTDVSFTNTFGDIIQNPTTLQVNTVGLPGAAVVRVFVNDQLLTSQAVSSREEAYLEGLELVGGDDCLEDAQLRVDVEAVPPDTTSIPPLLGRWTGQYRLCPAIDHQATLTGIPDDNVLYGIVRLEAQLDPPPFVAENVFYIFGIRQQGQSSDEWQTLPQDTPYASVLEWNIENEVGFPAGNYTLRIGVIVPGQETPIIDTVDVRIARKPFIGGELSNPSATLSGITSVEVRNYEGVSTMTAVFRPPGQPELNLGTFSVNRDAPTTTFDLRWLDVQDMLFAAQPAGTRQITGELVVTLYDSAGLPLYIWEGMPGVVYDTRIEVNPISFVLIVLGGLVTVVAAWSVALWMPRWLERRNSDPTSLFGEEYYLDCYDAAADRQFEVELGPRVLHIGRASQMPGRYPTDTIAFHDKTVSRRVGRIVMRGEQMVLIVEKDQVGRVQMNARPLSHHAEYDQRKRSVPLREEDQIELGNQGRNTIRLLRRE